MINKDFLRKVLKEEKTLLTLAELRCVTMPKYDELSVSKILQKVKDWPTMMKYFPDTLPKGRLPDRVYFFNVLNTVYP